MEESKAKTKIKKNADGSRSCYNLENQKKYRAKIRRVIIEFSLKNQEQLETLQDLAYSKNMTLPALCKQILIDHANSLN